MYYFDGKISVYGYIDLNKTKSNIWMIWIMNNLKIYLSKEIIICMIWEKLCLIIKNRSNNILRFFLIKVWLVFIFQILITYKYIFLIWILLIKISYELKKQYNILWIFFKKIIFFYKRISFQLRFKNIYRRKE